MKKYVKIFHLDFGDGNMKGLMKVLSIILAIMMVVATVPITATAATSGTCGENVYWNFDEDTGTLTISGTGKMDDYEDLELTSSDIVLQRPWESFSDVIVSVVINEGVTSVGNFAFCECTHIESVILPDSLKLIGEFAFYFCEYLLNITIPDKVTTIDDWSFVFCRSLKSVSIGFSVESIGENAFTNCDSLTSITIPDNTTLIGNRAFSGCSSLLAFNVESNNQNYSSLNGVLFNKDKSTLIQYPAGKPDATYIIPNSVKIIGVAAFLDSVNLTNITILDGPTSIGENAFTNCDSLTSITIPGTVEKIGTQAFNGCQALMNVIICDGTKKIDNFAFNYCTSLTNITIPDSVTEIGFCAFSLCDSLTDVYYPGTEEEWNNISIESYNDSLLNATIHYNSEYPENPTEPDELQSGLYVFSNNISMSYMIGDRIFLAVSQVEDNNYSVPEKLSITFTEPSKIELIDIFDYDYLKNSLPNPTDDIFPKNFKQCKFALLEAKEEGITDFVITNSDTSDTFRSYIMVSKDEYASIRTDELELRIDRGEKYNFVVNGMVISDFKCTEASGGYDFEMNVYNQKYSLGVVEVYNADNKLIQVEKIDKFAPEDSVAGAFAEGWYLVEDFFEGELLTFKQASIAKHKHVRVFVPQDGYIRVTNDSAVSTSCFILNLFDVISSSGGIISGTSSLSESQIDILDKKILEKFIFNSFYMETAKKYQENLKDMVAENVTESVLLSLISQAGGIAEGLLMDIDLSFEDICREALGTAASVGEEIFTKVTGPYGATLGALMNSRTVMNYTAQMRDWVYTTDRQGYYGIMTPYKSNYDSGMLTSGDGIKVETNGNVSDEVILQTVRILKDASVITMLDTGEILNDYIAYDISLVKSGEEVQPNGPVTVYLTVPSWFDDRTIVARQNEDGSWEMIEATVKNGIVSFEVDHFCKFIIGDVIGSLNIIEPSRTEIRNKDGIILHANIEGNTPEGSYVRWESSNGNFNEDADGSNLKIIAKNKGWTTFTAILYDADGNELARDSVEMYSKSGFFDKIGGFFRSLFGSTKIYDN